MDWALDHWFEITVALAIIALQVNHWLISRQLKDAKNDAVLQQVALDHLCGVAEAMTKHQRDTEISSTTIQQAISDLNLKYQHKEGFPGVIEATWEDVGAHGRFLTDLGGMSIKMCKQQFKEFRKALDTPLSTEPAAGSIADIMVDLDSFLTKQAEIEALSWGEKQSRVSK